MGFEKLFPRLAGRSGSQDLGQRRCMISSTNNQPHAGGLRQFFITLKRFDHEIQSQQAGIFRPYKRSLQSGAKRSVHPCFLLYKSRNTDGCTVQTISGIVDSCVSQIKASMVVILRYNSKFYHKRFQNGNKLILSCSIFSI